MVKPGKKSRRLAQKMWARLKNRLKEEVFSFSGGSLPVTGFDRLQKMRFAAKREEVAAFCRAFDRLT